MWFTALRRYRGVMVDLRTRRSVEAAPRIASRSVEPDLIPVGAALSARESQTTSAGFTGFFEVGLGPAFLN